MSLIFREGEELSAAKLTELAVHAVRVGVAGFSGYRGQIAPAGDWEGWIKITSAGTSGVYNWSELILDATGALVTGYGSGTIAGGTGARETNANNSVPLNSVVRAWQAVYEVQFQFESC